MLRLCGDGDGGPTWFNVYDTKYDKDFTEVKDDGTQYFRGGHEYHRPYGWNCYALKVLGRFENDKWLGEPGARVGSSQGEWPVSYHGTNVNASGHIAREGYDLSKGKHFKYGVGIYSTPSIHVAAKYAPVFEEKGRRYRIVFQNRVNPKNLKVVESDMGDGEYWVQPRQEFMRPYGICIQRC